MCTDLNDKLKLVSLANSACHCDLFKSTSTPDPPVSVIQQNISAVIINHMNIWIVMHCENMFNKENKQI